MSEWSKRRLGTLYNLRSERLSPSALGQATQYIGLEHMDPGNSRLERSGSTGRINSTVTPFRQDDVLFGRLRPYLRKVAHAHESGVCSPEILVLNPIREEVLPKFLQLLVASEPVIQHCITTSAGSRMPRTRAEDLGSIEVSVPPLQEQRRIVNLIDTIDASKWALKNVESDSGAVARAVRAATFDDVTVDPVPLREFCDIDGIQIGPFGTQLHAADYVDDGIPTVMPKDIVDGRITTTSISRVSYADWKRLQRHHLARGDIVLPRRGDLTKRALVTAEQGGWLCGTGSVRVRVARADPGEVFQALSAPSVDQWLQDNAVGITMPNLNTAIVGNIPVRLPLTGGTEIVGTLQALEDLGLACRTMAVRLETLRSGLVEDLLSGNHVIPDSYDCVLEQAS